jgi:para-nitrobenzyl esterase
MLPLVTVEAAATGAPFRSAVPGDMLAVALVRNRFRSPWTARLVGIKAAQALAAAILKNLNLSGSQIDQLKKVPYEQLLAAAVAGAQAVTKELGRPVTIGDAIADDTYVMREFCDWADAIPLLDGTVFSEFVGTLQRGETRKTEWSEKEVNDNLTAAFGDKKDAIAAEFKKVFPGKKVQDVLFFAATSRPSVKQTLARKLEKGKAPVFNYIFTWEYPVNGGQTSFHTCEIVFAMHNVTEPHCRMATGNDPAALALQDKISRAWINFAKTGNPSQPGLEWKPYTVADQQTMVFDTACGVRDMQDDKLVSLLPAVSRVSGPARRG